MSKGIETHTLVLVIMMAIFLLFGILIYIAFQGNYECAALSASCASQKFSYCGEWHSKCLTLDCPAPPGWEDIETCKIADKESVVSSCPVPSLQECKDILNIK